MSPVEWYEVHNSLVPILFQRTASKSKNFGLGYGQLAAAARLYNDTPQMADE
jgi:hypothetical protein